jgi:hypothetical protein
MFFICQDELEKSELNKEVEPLMPECRKIFIDEDGSFKMDEFFNRLSFLLNENGLCFSYHELLFDFGREIRFCIFIKDSETMRGIRTISSHPGPYATKSRISFFIYCMCEIEFLISKSLLKED